MKTMFGKLAEKHLTLAAAVASIVMVFALGQSAIALNSAKSTQNPCGTVPVCKVGQLCSKGCDCVNIIRGEGMCVTPE